jgi:hypothetical protein
MTTQLDAASARFLRPKSLPYLVFGPQRQAHGIFLNVLNLSIRYNFGDSFAHQRAETRAV